MNLVKVGNGLKNWEFQMNRVKYLIGNNKNIYPMYASIRQLESKTKSEYRAENNIQAKMMLDDQELSLKNNLFVEIRDEFSINEDRKLNSKSLMLKYLEVKLSHTDFTETINTIDILFQTLTEEINEASALKVLFPSIGSKQLLKMIGPYYESGYQKDEYDLSLVELLELQINMIDYIAANNIKYDQIIVYGRLNNMGNYLVERLNALANCRTIIFTNTYNESMRLDDVCLMENDIIDLANKEMFYHLFSMYSFRYYTIEEVQEMVINYLKANYTHKDHDIYQELEVFFQQ